MPSLILGVHDHQPVGNFDHVIAEAHDRAYRPFLDLLAAHPRLRMAVHISGPLLEWLKGRQRETLDLLGELVARGQVEMVGGGYWEPILTVLPERDQHEQLERMSRELQARFGARPRGIWLAERIWEPHLPKLLRAHGIDWVALDDGHFLSAGFAESELRGYFLTEEGGEPLAVFPISKRMRYLVPFARTDEVLAHLHSLAGGPEGDLAVLMDDGEKFGVWPGTHGHCYEEGYLEQLFAALEAAPGLTLTGFADYLDSHPPLGCAYLPTGSYAEMGEWSLPRRGQARVQALAALAKAEDPELAPFIRGGFWRNFFVKYEESHWMHKRMLWSARQAAAPGAPPEAAELVREAQCNCAYWHGLFGGLYLPHLRHAVFERLVRAEALAIPPGYALCEEDLDLDGRPELIWSSPRARAFLKPASGGRLRELDALDPAFALTNVLGRRAELYHDALRELAAAPAQEAAGAKSIHEITAVKEKGLERFLAVDPHARGSLEECLYAADAASLDYGGGWLDFSAIPFAAARPADPRGPLRLAAAWDFAPGRRLWLDKILAWEDDGAALAVALTLRYAGAEPLEAILASGWNLNLLAPDAPDRRVMVDGRPAARPALRSQGWERAIRRFELRDDWSDLSVALEAPEGEAKLDVWREPIETVSLSEAGFERVYQGSWIAVARSLSLRDGGSARLAYRVRLARPSAA